MTSHEGKHAGLPYAPGKDCPCQAREAQPLSYGECCGPWHRGLSEGLHAPTAVALMRSRYSAYALAQRNDALGHAMLNYLQATWHVSTQPGEMELSPLQWTGLEVLDAQEGQDAAAVEFNAYYKVNGKTEKMNELSRFVRVDTGLNSTTGANGAWKYIDGDVGA